MMIIKLISVPYLVESVNHLTVTLLTDTTTNYNPHHVMLAAKYTSTDEEGYVSSGVIIFDDQTASIWGVAVETRGEWTITTKARDGVVVEVIKRYNLLDSNNTITYTP